LFSVTALLPVLAGSTVSVALTVMVLGAGGNSGAVYMPVELMVPSVAFPPAMPFTNHPNVGREPSFAFAANCCVVSPGRVALAGVTMTEYPCEPLPGMIASAHPPSRTGNIDSSTNTERFTAAPPFSIAAIRAAGTHTRLFICDRKAFFAVGLVGEGYGG
jgi:hypothetical protein